jgi:Family of unknown function (DUF5670)
MNYILFSLVIILLLAWAIGLFVFDAGVIIHVLLVLALVILLFRILRNINIVK